MPPILSALLQQFQGEVDELMTLLEQKRINPRRWREQMQELLAKYHTSALMLGIGETAVPLQGLLIVQRALEVGQFPYLDNFYTTIAAAPAFNNAWRARAQLYANSPKSTFAEGDTYRQTGRFLPLPAMPAQGTQCLCITTPNSQVFTRRGNIPIGEIVPGDMVLTHKMRWRPVLRVIRRGPTPTHRQVYITVNGRTVGCTSDHRWLTPRGWRTPIDIYNKSYQVYNVPHEDMQNMRYKTWESKQVGYLQRMSPNLRMREQEGLSGGEMSCLCKQGISIEAMGIGTRQIEEIEGTQEIGGGEEEETRQSPVGANRFNQLGKQNRRPFPYPLLGKWQETVRLSLSISMDEGVWPHSRWVCSSPQEWGLDRRPDREPGTNETGTPQLPSFDRRPLQGNGRGWRKEISWTKVCPKTHDHMPELRKDIRGIRQARPTEEKLLNRMLQRDPQAEDFHLSGMQQTISGLPQEWQTTPEILFTGVLLPGTLLYDIEVQEDHSFIIEGVVTHNSNCQCSWDIKTLNEEAGDYDAYWRRGATDSCQTCIEREQQWNPVQIRNGRLIMDYA